MLSKMQTLFKRHRLLFKVFSLLMCVVMVFCYCGIQQAVTAEAVAGVDDIIVFVIALMIACGVSFTSAEVAENTAERFYDSADSEVKSIIEEAYAAYEADFVKDATIANGLFMCLASEWQQIFDAIAAFIWPQSVVVASSYVDFSADMSAYDSFLSLLQAEGTLTFEHQCTLDSYTSFSCGNLAIELIGKDVSSSVPSEVIEAWNNSSYSVWKDINVLMKISVLGTQYCFYQPLPDSFSYMSDYITFYGHSYEFKLDSNNVIGFNLVNSLSYAALLSGYNYIDYPSFGPYHFMYYGSNLINAIPTYDGSSYSLSCDAIPNLIGSDGILFGSDYLIPCDADRITDDYLTKAFTCDPTISIVNDYIGNDTTWQDSIADAGSGSIAFPLEVDDLISLSPSDVRDKTLTDSGDIVGDTSSDDAVSDTGSLSDTISSAISSVFIPSDSYFNDFNNRLEDTLSTKLPFITFINEFIASWNVEGRPLTFEFIFRDDKYVIDCGFYEPYRVRIRTCLSIFFIVLTWLSCFKMFRSLLGTGASTTVERTFDL